MKYNETEFFVKSIMGLDKLLGELEDKGNYKGIEIILNSLNDCQEIIGEAVINADPDIRGLLKDV